MMARRASAVRTAWGAMRPAPSQARWGARRGAVGSLDHGELSGHTARLRRVELLRDHRHAARPGILGGAREGLAREGLVLPEEGERLGAVIFGQHDGDDAAQIVLRRAAAECVY